jgi:hypothetical protein
MCPPGASSRSGNGRCSRPRAVPPPPHLQFSISPLFLPQLSRQASAQRLEGHQPGRAGRGHGAPSRTALVLPRSRRLQHRGRRTAPGRRAQGSGVPRPSAASGQLLERSPGADGRVDAGTLRGDRGSHRPLPGSAVWTPRRGLPGQRPPDPPRPLTWPRGAAARTAAGAGAAASPARPWPRRRCAGRGRPASGQQSCFACGRAATPEGGSAKSAARARGADGARNPPRPAPRSTPARPRRATRPTAPRAGNAPPTPRPALARSPTPPGRSSALIRHRRHCIRAAPPPHPTRHRTFHTASSPELPLSCAHRSPSVLGHRSGWGVWRPGPPNSRSSWLQAGPSRNLSHKQPYRKTRMDRRTNWLSLTLGLPGGVVGAPRSRVAWVGGMEDAVVLRYHHLSQKKTPPLHTLPSPGASDAASRP